MKRVLFLTGTRADFGKIKPLIKNLDSNPDFETQVFVTGMHLMKRYGSTANEVIRSNFKNVFLYMNQDATYHQSMDFTFANTVNGLGRYIREFPADLMVIHGDRIEAMAGALVGVLNNMRVAHIEGGELSGTIDDSLRHAISKLAHLHFVANDEARVRLIQMGEKPESIYVIGSPDIDVMLSKALPDIAEVKSHYEINFDDYFILLVHPVTTEIDSLESNLEELTQAIEASGKNFVVIYPNNDLGAETIFKAYQELEENPHFRILPSVRFEYFLTLLKHSGGIVGNSSAGIREASVYGVPTIDVGTRQNRRLKHTSIVSVGWERKAILHALQSLPKSTPVSLNFGSGDSAEQFLKALQTDALWQLPIQKEFCDL